MHIPDGYLSPSTCAVLYGAAMPFWYGGVRAGQAAAEYQAGAAAGGRQRILLCHHDVQYSASRRNDGTRGGRRRGRDRAGAVGVDARGVHRAADPGGVFRRRRDHNARRELLQHGDCGLAGGSFWSTALVAGRAELTSSRRTIAAALAGYAAINASAFLTACELGIQPLFFKDASGAPLYAPYPLHIAIPAMMIGHLYLRRIGGTVCVGRSGGVSAAYESFTAGQNSAFAPSDDHSDVRRLRHAC